MELEWAELEPIRRGTLLLTFTTRDKDAPERAMRTFWNWYDKRFGRPHFAWLEQFKDESGWHYHAIVPDAPRADVGHSADALQAEWARATRRNVSDVNVDLSWLPKWKKKGKRGPVAYALSYAKKSGPKKYQQEYDDAPRGLHTVLYTRLQVPLALVCRVSDDLRDFLQTAGVQPIERPSRCRGGGWLVGVRRRSPVDGTCWLRLQVLQEVDLAAGVVRTLGVACEADESHPPRGSLVRRRLTARHALTSVTDWRQAGARHPRAGRRASAHSCAEESTAERSRLTQLSAIQPASRARIPAQSKVIHAAPRSGAVPTSTQLDITSLDIGHGHAGRAGHRLEADKQKPVASSVLRPVATGSLKGKDAGSCAIPSGQ